MPGIDYEKVNELYNKDIILMYGEEQQMTDLEIAEFNKAIAKSVAYLQIAKRLAIKAKQRFSESR